MTTIEKIVIAVIMRQHFLQSVFHLHTFRYEELQWVQKLLTITHSINFRPSTNILSLSVAVDTPGYKCTSKSFFIWGTARKFARKNCYRFSVANKLRLLLKSVPKAEEGEKEMLRDHTHEAPNALHIVVVIFVVSSNCFFQFRSALSFSVYLLHAVCHFMCAGQSRFVYTCSSMPEFLQCLTYCKD